MISKGTPEGSGARPDRSQSMRMLSESADELLELLCAGDPERVRAAVDAGDERRLADPLDITIESLRDRMTRIGRLAAAARDGDDALPSEEQSGPTLLS
jgi:hypothetical protein